MPINTFNTGLKAVLLQTHGTEWYPVAYSSHTLTSAGRNYTKLEKETLGDVYGWQRFHEFVYGRIVTLETEHKLLTAIPQKPLDDTPPHFQHKYHLVAAD